MNILLWLIPLLPLTGFVVLALAGARLPRVGVALVGAGSVGLAAVTAGLVATLFYSAGADPVIARLAPWFRVGDLATDFTLYLDQLAVIMSLVITGVGFLIHWFSTEFMLEEVDYRRYFAYLNLFVAAMLMLVLADNLVLLFLGWEGVGLCSYLLIGYWHRDPANGYAARKAFVVTRIGDVALLLGLFLLFVELGELSIQPLLAGAPIYFESGAARMELIGLLLLGGAVGKSAQLPLQTWLPDAMAGPSPVSALIHAATMVTAGVYLIARLHPLFELAPVAQTVVALVGLATLLVAAWAALSQRDIKRILAYSTISQIGYMFLALGVGAWGAAIFHLVTHAFFKALLFLGAGRVIEHMHHEHDIFRMGGLRRVMPFTFVVFLAGAASLAAVPWLTAGFYSKDKILLAAAGAPELGTLLFAGGILGALMTAFYTFRLVFTVFFGEPVTQEREHAGWSIKVPLTLLGVLSIVGAVIPLPLGEVFPKHHTAHNTALVLLAAGVALAGIALAWWTHGRRRPTGETRGWPLWRRGLDRWQASGLGFDAIYGALVEAPFNGLARVLRGELVDRVVALVIAVNQGLNTLTVRLQNGRVRHYAVGVVIGVLVLMIPGVWL